MEKNMQHINETINCCNQDVAPMDLTQLTKSKLTCMHQIAQPHKGTKNEVKIKPKIKKLPYFIPIHLHTNF